VEATDASRRVSDAVHADSEGSGNVAGVVNDTTHTVAAAVDGEQGSGSAGADADSETGVGADDVTLCDAPLLRPGLRQRRGRSGDDVSPSVAVTVVCAVSVCSGPVHLLLLITKHVSHCICFIDIVKTCKTVETVVAVIDHHVWA
jgi:hypothetical protein